MVPMVEAANPEATCIDGGKGSSHGWNITSEAKPGHLCHTLTKTIIPFTCCFTGRHFASYLSKHSSD